MSDDLISRKDALDCINITLSNFGIEFGDALRSALEDDLKNLYTAFDKEKVLTKMRRKYVDAIDMYNSDKGTAYAYSSEVRKDAWGKAIEIVEKGGIE